MTLERNIGYDRITGGLHVGIGSNIQEFLKKHLYTLNKTLGILLNVIFLIRCHEVAG